MLHRLATAYRTVFAKIDLTASDQHAGFALAAALQACQNHPSSPVRLVRRRFAADFKSASVACMSRRAGHSRAVTAKRASVGWQWQRVVRPLGGAAAVLRSQCPSPLQARRRRAWTERALLSGKPPESKPEEAGSGSPKVRTLLPRCGESLGHEPEHHTMTGGARGGPGASSSDPIPCKGHEASARLPAGHYAAAPTAGRAPEQGVRSSRVTSRVVAGDTLRRAAIANSQAPQSPARALGAHARAATASEGSEGPEASSAGSCVSIAGARSKTLPAAASPARFAVHARAAPGPPWRGSQHSATGDTRACSAAGGCEALAGSGAGAPLAGAGCSDVEAQSGGRPFLHRLPTPFSAAGPPAASPGRSRGEPSAVDQRPQARGRSGSLGSAALPRPGGPDPRLPPNPGSPAGMRRWESGTSWVLERLWDFFLAPSPSGAMARAGSKGVPPETAVHGCFGSGGGDADEDRGARVAEGAGGSGLGCTLPLARSISQRFPAFLTPTGLAGKVRVLCA